MGVAQPDPVGQTPVDKLMTPANAVTLARICLVPVFVVALISPWPQFFELPQIVDDAKGLVAAVIFILISCTDWLDGYLARSRGEVTDFGKFMDPLADKILVAAALLALIELGSLPSWVVLVILAREFIVSGVRMVAASEGVVIAASWYGKAKTVAQMIAIVLFVTKDSHMIGSVHVAVADGMWLISWAVMIVALVLTLVSMLDYIAKARHLLGFKPRRKKAAPTARVDGPAGAKEEGARSGAPLSAADAASIEQGALLGLAREVLAAAESGHASLGTAESLTGGLIAATLTEVPGSSEHLRGGIVSYDLAVKRSLLGVSGESLEREGAVTEACARSMAEGARRQLGCDVAVAATGIAGPGGAEPGKPVGSVWIGLADSRSTRARRFEFPGERDEVRLLAVRHALEMMRAVLRER